MHEQQCRRRRDQAERRKILARIVTDIAENVRTRRQRRGVNENDRAGGVIICRLSHGYDEEDRRCRNASKRSQSRHTFLHFFASTFFLPDRPPAAATRIQTTPDPLPPPV